MRIQNAETPIRRACEILCEVGQLLLRELEGAVGRREQLRGGDAHRRCRREQVATCVQLRGGLLLDALDCLRRKTVRGAQGWGAFAVSRRRGELGHGGGHCFVTRVGVWLGLGGKAQIRRRPSVYRIRERRTQRARLHGAFLCTVSRAVHVSGWICTAHPYLSKLGPAPHRPCRS